MKKIACFCLLAASATAGAQSLIFGTACNIPGSFTHPGTLYMDGSRIYATAYQGTLYVLDKNKPCKVLEARKLNSVGLSGVNGNLFQLFVSGLDGKVWTFLKTNPLTLVSLKQVAQCNLSEIEAMGLTVYVGVGSASMAVDRQHVYLSALNGSDMVEATRRNSTSPIVYGTGAIAGTTGIYDRKTGVLQATITNPSTNAVNLYVNRGTLYITAFATPGVYMYDTTTLQQTFVPRWYANTVTTIQTRKTGLMLVGDEYGQLGLYSLAAGYPLLSNLDFRELINRFESEVIEIRDVVTDGSLVIAASSWGNDILRNSTDPPPPPSLFYVRLQ